MNQHSLPVAKEAHVSCLLVYGYYLLQTGSAGISPNLSSFVIFFYTRHSLVIRL